MNHLSPQRLTQIPSNSDFHTHFWSSRKPLIVSLNNPELLARYQEWTPDAVFTRMREHGEAVTPQMLWFDMDEGLLIDRQDLPPFVCEHLYHPDYITRRQHYRLFFHPKGHTTSLHYEGNLLDVFSYQIKGVKRWKIRRGDKAYKLLPFYFLENQATYAFGQEPDWTYVFDLQPGELLFLPRGWYHQVECLTDDNVALSVVSAPRDVEALRGLTLDIYREQLALQYHFRHILPARFADKIKTFITYDNDGLKWAKHFIEGISPCALLRRLAIDLGVVSPALVAALLFNREVRNYLKYLARFQERLQRQLLGQEVVEQ